MSSPFDARPIVVAVAGPNGAASRLGLKRTTLQYKIKKLGITRNQWWPSAMT